MGAKPMPKPGWTINLVEGKLAAPLQLHGKTVTSAVREITWRGGPLPDAYYDEFVLMVKLLLLSSDELSAAGAHADAPAPVLEVLAPGGDMSGVAHHH